MKWRVKNKNRDIYTCITMERKSPEKHGVKTKEIEAVRFNKKARRGKKKERDGESGRELKLAARLVVFFNFPSWLPLFLPLSLFPLSFLSRLCPHSLQRVHSRWYVPFAFVIVFVALSFSFQKTKREQKNGEFVSCLEYIIREKRYVVWKKNFPIKIKRCLLAPRLNEIEFLSAGEMVSCFVREIGIGRLGDLSY